MRLAEGGHPCSRTPAATGERKARNKMQEWHLKWPMLLLALYSHWHVAHAISVEGPKGHTDGDVDAEEFLWSQLPGRCCMQLREKCPFPDSPRDECEIITPDSCAQCEVWSEPDNFCHTSEDTCYTCGMSLWCGKPPPLVAGNKVCVGTSRVGTGCWDDYGTGICAIQDLDDCQAACRKTKFCEMFVFYPLEKKGSCVLCSDLFHTESSGGANARIYTLTPAPPPPHVNVKTGYAIVAERPPPFLSPPSPPPAPPPQSPQASALGRTGLAVTAAVTDNVECSFSEGIEFAVDRSSGYSDYVVKTREECCNLCGRQMECTDFVFQPSTGACVLLPLVPMAELERRPNLNVVSGSMRISAAAHEEIETHCSYRPDQGYSGSSLGQGHLPLSRDIQSRQDCCDACGRNEECRKFTFNEETHNCMLFPSYAELYSLPLGGMLAGAIEDGSTLRGGVRLPPSPPKGADGNGPLAPAFKTFHQAPPPPPPSVKIGETEQTQGIIAYLSLAVIILMAGVLSCFLYCFYSPEVSMLMFMLSNGKMGKQRTAPNARAKEEAASVAALPMSRRKGALEEGYAKVTVQTEAMTQNKDLYIGVCANLAEIKQIIFEEFGHLLKEVKPQQTILLCQTTAEGGDPWLLVSDTSNFSLVQEKARCWKLLQSGSEDITYETAFPKETKESKRKKAGGEASPSAVLPTEDGDESTALVTPVVSDTPSGRTSGGKPSKKGARKANGKAKGGATRANDQAEPAEKPRRAVYEEPLVLQAPSPPPEEVTESTDDETITSRTQLVPSGGTPKRKGGTPLADVLKPRALRAPSAVGGWDDDSDLKSNRSRIQDDGM